MRVLAGVVQALRPLGLAAGEDGFNCDFHAIRHHGEQAVLEKHYVPRRSQRTRAVLTFFAQDHAAGDMVYSNADITKAEQAQEIIAFADYWKNATGSDPGLLVFDSQLTTYAILDELSSRGITWLTLRQRGKAELARLDALPASEWTAAVITRSGRYRRPRMHEDMIKLSGISTKVRQIAIKNIGRDEPTLLITNDLTTGRKNLFARYAERMMIKNELDAYRRVPPRRPHQRRLTQRRPRHHPDRRRRPGQSAPRAQAVPVRTSNPRHPVARLPRRHRHPAHRRNRRHLRPEPARHPPHPHRRWLRRTRHPHPLVGRPHPPLHLPVTLNRAADAHLNSII